MDSQWRPAFLLSMSACVIGLVTSTDLTRTGEIWPIGTHSLPTMSLCTITIQSVTGFNCCACFHIQYARVCPTLRFQWIAAGYCNTDAFFQLLAGLLAIAPLGWESFNGCWANEWISKMAQKGVKWKHEVEQTSKLCYLWLYIIRGALSLSKNTVKLIKCFQMSMAWCVAIFQPFGHTKLGAESSHKDLLRIFLLLQFVWPQRRLFQPLVPLAKLHPSNVPTKWPNFWWISPQTSLHPTRCHTRSFISWWPVLMVDKATQGGNI